MPAQPVAAPAKSARLPLPRGRARVSVAGPPRATVLHAAEPEEYRPHISVHRSARTRTSRERSSHPASSAWHLPARAASARDHAAMPQSLRPQIPGVRVLPDRWCAPIPVCHAISCRRENRAPRNPTPDVASDVQLIACPGRLLRRSGRFAFSRTMLGSPIGMATTTPRAGPAGKGVQRAVSGPLSARAEANAGSLDLCRLSADPLRTQDFLHTPGANPAAAPTETQLPGSVATTRPAVVDGSVLSQPFSLTPGPVRIL